MVTGGIVSTGAGGGMVSSGNITAPGLVLAGNTFANGPAITISNDGMLLTAGATNGVRINNSVNGVELFRVANNGNVTASGPITASIVNAQLTVPADAWSIRAGASDQMYFTASNVATYYKADSHFFRNAADSTVLTIGQTGTLTASGLITASAGLVATGDITLPTNLNFSNGVLGRIYHRSFARLTFFYNVNSYQASQHDFYNYDAVKVASLNSAGDFAITGHMTSVVQFLSTDPTSSDLSAGQTRTVKNTSTGTTKVWLNDGGTFKSLTFA